MTYKAFIGIDFDCPTFKKHHTMPLHDSVADSAAECFQKAQQIIADMRPAYERSGWATSDSKDGFTGSRNGSANIYSDIIVKEMDRPIAKPAPPKRTASKVSDNEMAFLADLADLCKRFGMVVENC